METIIESLPRYLTTASAPEHNSECCAFVAVIALAVLVVGVSART